MSGAAVGLSLGLSLALILASEGTAQQHHEAAEPQVLAPGYSKLEFEAPVPGTYALPSLGLAEDGAVLDSGGRPTRLSHLLGEKVTVLSFIYTSCTDVNGCPLASFVLGQVQNALMEDAGLAGEVRLVSLSFDPGHDTPQVMQNYSKSFRKESFDWRFLTCESEQALAPILADYDQYVLKSYDAEGRVLSVMAHILRVYLIDRAGHIRNIYSPSFLHAETVVADIRTVLLQTASSE